MTKAVHNDAYQPQWYEHKMLTALLEYFVTGGHQFCIQVYVLLEYFNSTLYIVVRTPFPMGETTGKDR